MRDIVQAVSAHLFSEEDKHVFAVLDGASIPDLRQALFEHEPPHECLYRGELQPDMEAVAPYLVQLEPKSAFTEWIIRQGWGKHWGIFAVCSGDLRAVRGHFRAFITVHDTNGKPLLFRYYDPRVLRVFLPTCKPEELTQFFGPVSSYLLEAEEPETVLCFRAADGALRQDKRKLELS